MKYELHKPISHCMHCKPMLGNNFTNKNKLPNSECTLRVKKQWEQMHYLIIKNTLDSVQGWGGSSGSQRQVKWGLLWGTAANRAGAEISLSPDSAWERWGGQRTGEDRQLLIRMYCHFPRNSEAERRNGGEILAYKKWSHYSKLRRKTAKSRGYSHIASAPWLNSFPY